MGRNISGKIGFLIASFTLIFFLHNDFMDIGHKNLGNISLVKASKATNNVEKYFWAQCGINNYVTLGINLPKTRLAESYKLLWQSASKLGKEAIALNAYRIGHELTDDNLFDRVNCLPTLGKIEAEEFNGIEPGTMSVLRWVDNRLGVLLFSAQPISYSVCLSSQGIYEVSVVSRENIPPPIKIEVSWDGWIADVLDFKQGNEYWTSQSATIVSPAGEHELQLKFTNDFQDEQKDVDRNAVIDYVEIIQVPSKQYND